MATEWSSNQKKFLYYCIAGVESNWNYDACNISDAITLGITQWWGHNAARLLETVKVMAADRYEGLSDRLKGFVEDHPSSETGFWDYTFLYQSDADSWQAINDAGPEVPLAQDTLFYSDTFGTEWVGGQLAILQSWGQDLDNIKGTIMLFSCFHQNQQSALNVIRSIGGNRDFNDVHAAILNDGVVGSYVNRYNQVRDWLAGWDGLSAPPDFGATNPGNIPSNPDTDNQLASNVRYIQAYSNQDLIIYGAMDTGDKLICVYNGNNTWIPVRNSAGPSYPSTGGDANPGDGNDPEFEKMKALWIQYENQWSYSSGAGRLNPPVSGYTDCSGGVWWAANAATNNKYQWLGTSTYTMRETAAKVYSSSDGTIDTSILKPGDLIITGGIAYDQHVAWVWGDGTAWGCGWAPLPKVEKTNLATGYVGEVQWLEVYRFLNDE